LGCLIAAAPLKLGENVVQPIRSRFWWLTSFGFVWVCLGLFWKKAHPKFDQTWWLILIFLIKAASLGLSPCFWTNYFVGH
jgi:hypothetical protein